MKGFLSLMPEDLAQASKARVIWRIYFLSNKYILYHIRFFPALSFTASSIKLNQYNLFKTGLAVVSVLIQELFIYKSFQDKYSLIIFFFLLTTV